MTKGVFKLDAKDKASFFSSTVVCCLPAPSVTKPGASVHMLSRKDLNSDELETVRLPMNPITVVTANGEVQTKKESTVCVKEFDLFVTIKLLDDTQAVLSL